MNYSNNAYSVTVGNIASGATAISVASGTGSRFPASDFRVTLIGYDALGNENAWEICHCSSRTDDVLTVTRGQEGTTAVGWGGGSRIENRVTAGVMASIDVASGTTSQYWRGDKSWRDFFTDVRAATLTGLSTATNAVISAADTVLSAFGKLQAQITSHVGSSSNPHSVTKAQVGLGNVDNTTDAGKPVSTAQQTALDLKANQADVVLLTGNQTIAGTKTFSSAISGSVTGTAANVTGIVALANGGTGATTAAAARTALGLGSAATVNTGTSGAAIPLLNGANTHSGANTFSSAVDVTGRYAGGIVAVAALDIACGAGNYFTKTISANSTFTFSGAPASLAYSFVLELTHTSGTVTWPANVRWPNNAAPTLTTGKTHIFIFVTDDGGTTWRGAVLANYNN